MQKTINILLALPEPVVEFSDNTIDYLGLGLGDADVPDLISISREQHSNMEGVEAGEADSEKMEELCVHAWRALTAFGNPEIIPDLLDLLEEVSANNSDRYDEDFSDLMVSFGADAIDYMVSYIESEQHEEENKVMSIEALGMMVEDDDLRPRVFEFFERYLRAKELNRTTNAFIIYVFIETQAVEYHQLIKDSFAVHLVNVLICGDLEDCEIAMGLREKRETERPNYAELDLELETLARKEIAGELAAEASNGEVIDHYFFVYKRMNSMANAVTVDGLLLASLLAPEMVPPSKFIPHLWDAFEGDPDKQMLWPSAEEAKRFYGAVMGLHQENRSLLAAQNYTPSKMHRKGGWGLVDALSPWILGFLIGLRFWEEQNQEDPLLKAFMKIADEILSVEEERNLKPGAIATQEFILEGLIEKAYRERCAGASPSVGREPLPKVGRNDACPCGSGKKYKRCCIN